MSSHYTTPDPHQTSLEEALFYEPVQQAPLALEEAPSLEGAALPIFRVQLVREGELPLTERPQITQPGDVARIFRDFLGDRDREVFAILMLDVKNRLLGLNVVSIGILDCSLVHPRECFKPAIVIGAAAILLCHTHPSGDVTISEEDKVVTRRLMEAGKLLGIEVLDHLVIGEGNRYSSMKKQGLC